MSQPAPLSPRPPRAGAPHPGRRRPARPAAAVISAGTAQALADTFRVLGDPTRVRILDALARTEVPDTAGPALMLSVAAATEPETPPTKALLKATETGANWLALSTGRGMSPRLLSGMFL